MIFILIPFLIALGVAVAVAMIFRSFLTMRLPIVIAVGGGVFFLLGVVLLLFVPPPDF